MDPTGSKLCSFYFICVAALYPCMYEYLMMEPLGPTSPQFHQLNTATLGTRVPAPELTAGRCKPYANAPMKISGPVSSPPAVSSSPLFRPLLSYHPLLLCPPLPLSLFPSLSASRK